MKETILITGCLGTVGIYTTNKLLENNYRVIGIDNCSTNNIMRLGEINNINNNFQYYNNDDWGLESVFSSNKIDKVLHLASLIGSYVTDNDINYFNSNVKLTFDLLNLSKKYNVSKFVYASSSSVYGEGKKSRPALETDSKNPLSIYGITKSNSEDYVNYFHNIHGLNTIIFRYTNIFANIKYQGYRSIITKFIEKIQKGEQLTLFNKGKSKRQHIFIDNVVFANYLALTNDDEKLNGETFNISVEDNPISILDLVKMLYEKLNIEPNYVLSDEIQTGDADINWEDINKAKEILGYKVLVNMEDGINSHIQYKLG